ncbi:MAG: hypothetical protein K2P81_13225 [Bacteriovoracaceae bacterium]|nr:hypothetical protein [Bacteriovoracaceae bacterium]
MKRSLLCFVFFVSMLFALDAPAASWKSETKAILREYSYACRNSEVVVDEIVKDSHISGHIVGLPYEALEKFKVIFYVKTNRWYVHPFFQPENPQEGSAFAAINQDGTFKIQTIKRRVDASRLAVSVVPSPYVIKSQMLWLKPFLGLFGGVFKYSCRGVVVPLNGEI